MTFRVLLCPVCVFMLLSCLPGTCIKIKYSCNKFITKKEAEPITVLTKMKGRCVLKNLRRAVVQKLPGFELAQI